MISSLKNAFFEEFTQSRVSVGTLTEKKKSENMVGKRENTGNQHFLFFTTMFSYYSRHQFRFSVVERGSLYIWFYRAGFFFATVVLGRSYKIKNIAEKGKILIATKFYSCSETNISIAEESFVRRLKKTF